MKDYNFKLNYEWLIGGGMVTITFLVNVFLMKIVIVNGALGISFDGTLLEGTAIARFIIGLMGY